MAVISAVGTVLTISPSKTFLYAPVIVTEFADDADAIDFPDVEIAGFAVNPNGQPSYWTKASLITMNINIRPGSLSDVLLGLIFKSNWAGENKTVAEDGIVATIINPNLATANGKIVLGGGRMISGSPASGFTSEGKSKTKAYSFTFSQLGNLS